MNRICASNFCDQLRVSGFSCHLRYNVTWLPVVGAPSVWFIQNDPQQILLSILSQVPTLSLELFQLVEPSEGVSDAAKMSFEKQMKKTKFKQSHLYFTLNGSL